MSDLVELKPCPFCGGRFVAQGASREFISVWCGCGAQGPSVPFPETCIDPVTPIRKCYELWNRRAPDPELSRLSALVAEWQKAAEPFVAVAQNDIDECEADADFFRPIGIKYARVKLLTVGDFRRLSRLKDTTNADK